MVPMQRFFVREAACWKFPLLRWLVVLPRMELREEVADTACTGFSMSSGTIALDAVAMYKTVQHVAWREEKATKNRFSDSNWTPCGRFPTHHITTRGSRPAAHGLKRQWQRGDAGR
jgi:hypothetical protein